MHYFNASLFYVVLVAITLSIIELAHIALCKYYTMLCSPILILCCLMLRYVNVPLFDVKRLDDASLFNVALFNVSLFNLALFNVALFNVASF